MIGKAVTVVYKPALVSVLTIFTNYSNNRHYMSLNMNLKQIESESILGFPLFYQQKKYRRQFSIQRRGI